MTTPANNYRRFRSRPADLTPPSPTARIPASNGLPPSIRKSLLVDYYLAECRPRAGSHAARRRTLHPAAGGYPGLRPGRPGMKWSTAGEDFRQTGGTPGLISQVPGQPGSRRARALVNSGAQRASPAPGLDAHAIVSNFTDPGGGLSSTSTTGLLTNGYRQGKLPA